MRIYLDLILFWLRVRVPRVKRRKVEFPVLESQVASPKLTFERSIIQNTTHTLHCLLSSSVSLYVSLKLPLSIKYKINRINSRKTRNECQIPVHTL